MPSNIVQVLKSYDKYERDLINALKEGVADTLDDIGIHAVSRFGTRGHLGILTGNLSRSLLGKKDSIRKVILFRNRVIGEIGTTVKSKGGFDYASYWESHGRPFLEPATRAKEGRLIENIEKRINRVHSN